MQFQTKQAELIRQGVVPIAGSKLLPYIHKHLSSNNAWLVKAAFDAAGACLEQFRALLGDESPALVGDEGSDMLERSCAEEGHMKKYDCSDESLVSLEESIALIGSESVIHTEPSDMVKAYFNLSASVVAAVTPRGGDGSSSSGRDGSSNSSIDVEWGTPDLSRAILLALRSVHWYHVRDVASILSHAHPITALQLGGGVYSALILCVAQRFQIFYDFCMCREPNLPNSLADLDLAYASYVRPCNDILDGLQSCATMSQDDIDKSCKVSRSPKRLAEFSTPSAARCTMNRLVFEAYSIMEGRLRVDSEIAFKICHHAETVLSESVSTNRTQSPQAWSTLLWAARILSLERLACLLSNDDEAERSPYLDRHIGQGIAAMCIAAADKIHESAFLDDISVVSDCEDQNNNDVLEIIAAVEQLLQLLTSNSSSLSTTYKCRAAILTLVESISSLSSAMFNFEERLEVDLQTWRDREVEAELQERLYKLVPARRVVTYIDNSSDNPTPSWSKNRPRYGNAYNPGSYKQVQVVTDTGGDGHWLCLYEGLFSRDEDCHFACQG